MQIASDLISQQAVYTYMEFLILGLVLGAAQGLVVGAPLGREVHLGVALVYQTHRYIHTVHVQPADEVTTLVHGFHLHFHLWGGELCTFTLQSTFILHRFL